MKKYYRYGLKIFYLFYKRLNGSGLEQVLVLGLPYERVCPSFIHSVIHSLSHTVTPSRQLGTIKPRKFYKLQIKELLFSLSGSSFFFLFYSSSFPPVYCLSDFQYTECLKSYRKSVLHLLKYRFVVYLSRCSTDLR